VEHTKELIGGSGPVSRKRHGTPRRASIRVVNDFGQGSASHRACFRYGVKSFTTDDELNDACAHGVFTGMRLNDATPTK
jgi:hypothetical protein